TIGSILSLLVRAAVAGLGAVLAPVSRTALSGRVSTSVLTGVIEWDNSAAGRCVRCLLLGALVPAVLNGVLRGLLTSGGLRELLGTLRGGRGGVVPLLAVGGGVIVLVSPSTVGLLLSSHILPIALLTIIRGIIALLAIGRSVIGLLSTSTLRLLLSSHILPIAVLTISRSVIALLAIGRSVIVLLSTMTVRLQLSSHILPIALLTISRGIIALLAI